MKYENYFHNITIIILTIILLSVSISNTFALDTKNQQNDLYLNALNSSGYIIEFTDKPLVRFRSELIDSIKKNNTDLDNNKIVTFIKSKIEKHKNKLSSIHNTVRNEIIKLLKDKPIGNIITHTYTKIFNGLAINNIDDSILNRIKKLSFVKNIFPNKRIYYSLNESVSLINATDVWDLHDLHGQNIDGRGITIAFIDSGVDYNHIDLKNNYLGGYDFANEDDDPIDHAGHGTFCTGIAVGTGRQSGNKYVGVAPGAKFYSYKVFTDDEQTGLDSWAIAAMEEAMVVGVDIISLSIGTVDKGSPTDPLSIAADNAVDAGIVVVAAAGNNGSQGSGHIQSPGCAQQVICVGASTKSDRMAYYSSMGPVAWDDNYMVKPDVVAPGNYITSTCLNGGYTTASGTSSSTPHVSGAAALLLQAHPEWNPHDVKQALKKHAIKLKDETGNYYDVNKQGSGKIDVLSTINLSSAPPIAILNIPSVVNHGIVEINGTAMNGTGCSKDFVNFSLSYYDDEWIFINHSNKEVKNGFLCSWNTSEIDNGNYKLKLIVRGRDQVSIDIVTISIGLSKDQIIIQAPNKVNESVSFTINITNPYKEPIKAFVFLFIPNHIPRIFYGSSMHVKTPRIINPLLKSVRGKILCIKLFDFQKEEKEIEIINTNICIKD